MSKMVVVFTLDGCGHCTHLKKMLYNENIDFNEIEVSSNREIWDSVVDQTGYNALPSVYITNEGSEQGIIFVPERDYESPDDLVEKIKNVLNV